MPRVQHRRHGGIVTNRTRRCGVRELEKRCQALFPLRVDGGPPDETSGGGMPWYFVAVGLFDRRFGGRRAFGRVGKGIWISRKGGVRTQRYLWQRSKHSEAFGTTGADDEGLLNAEAFANCFRSIIARNGGQSEADSERTSQILTRLFDVFDI